MALCKIIAITKNPSPVISDGEMLKFCISYNVPSYSCVLQTNYLTKRNVELRTSRAKVTQSSTSAGYNLVAIYLSPLLLSCMDIYFCLTNLITVPEHAPTSRPYSFWNVCCLACLTKYYSSFEARFRPAVP